MQLRGHAKVHEVRAETVVVRGDAIVADSVLCGTLLVLGTLRVRSIRCRLILVKGRILAEAVRASTFIALLEGLSRVSVINAERVLVATSKQGVLVVKVLKAGYVVLEGVVALYLSSSQGGLVCTPSRVACFERRPDECVISPGASITRTG